jgi:hypothetical protein
MTVLLFQKTTSLNTLNDALDGHLSCWGSAALHTYLQELTHNFSAAIYNIQVLKDKYCELTLEQVQDKFNLLDASVEECEDYLYGNDSVGETLIDNNRELRLFLFYKG